MTPLKQDFIAFKMNVISIRKWIVDTDVVIDVRCTHHDVIKSVGILAGDQWWPRTSGGCLRFVRAITYLLRHRISNFVKGNKRNLHKKDWLNSRSVRQKVDSFPNPPTCQHPGISWGQQPIRHIYLNAEINMYKVMY